MGLSVIRTELIVGDCIDVLWDESTFYSFKNKFDLVFSDPPFNIGKNYQSHQDRMQKKDYQILIRNSISLSYEMLKDGGSIFLSINDENVAYCYQILEHYLFRFRNWIIWEYNFGNYCSTKFGRNKTHILYFCKGDKPNKFNADDVLVPSARQTKYNDKRAVSKGRVPGDVWDFPRVCGTFKERNKKKHPCQMPETVLDRIIRVATDPGDWVLDPFAGTGTTLAVANRLGRNSLGVEISEEYCQGIQQRIPELLIMNKETQHV